MEKTAETEQAHTGLTERTAARKKRKNCNYAELGASCFCPRPICFPWDRKRISLVGQFLDSS